MLPSNTIFRSSNGLPNVRQIEQWIETATAFERSGDLAKAANLLDRVMRAVPDHHWVISLAGIIAYRRGRPGEALSYFRRAIKIDGTVVLYQSNISKYYMKEGRLDEALSHARRAVQLAPSDPRILTTLALIYRDRLELRPALSSIRRALELDPSSRDAHFLLGELLLLMGQFKEGWEEYEWIVNPTSGITPGILPNHSIVWDGKSTVAGTLLLYTDQGFGDTIQFSRYIPLLAPKCEDILVLCDAKIKPVVEQQPGIRRFISDSESEPSISAFCSFSSLPRHFHTQLGSIPFSSPLRADRAKAEHWRGRLDSLVPTGLRRIGIVWAGNPDHPNDVNRSAGLKVMSPLFEQSDIAVISLQVGKAKEEISAYSGSAPLIDLGSEIIDFSDTMGILDGLERLITVDTSVAHLAGAMGMQVSLLLPFSPDWRWLLDRSDSPWYPTVRLYRQLHPRRWEQPIRAILADLQR